MGVIDVERRVANKIEATTSTFLFETSNWTHSCARPGGADCSRQRLKFK